MLRMLNNFEFEKNSYKVTSSERNKMSVDHEDLKMLNLTNIRNLRPLEVVGRGTEIELQVV